MKLNTSKKAFRTLQTITILFLVVIFSQTKTQIAEAQFVTKSFTTVVADVSYTGILNNISLVGTRLKEWGLDKVAYLLAKQALHRMTVDVVGWINSGYKGRPAFLTNPQGFFLDAADQVTGELLDTNGPLRNLCSPWSVDIRASLAFGQLQSSANGMPGYYRYTCTLGSIINNYRGVNVSASVAGYGNRIDAFVKGDFRQGGWPAFIALTTEDRNNPIGTNLMLRSDQLYAVSQRQAAISTDLQQGRGFLSWESCDDITTGDPEELLASGDPSIKRGPSGTPQRCTTRTPGSVIAESLSDQLRTPTDELLLADDMNAIFDAAITQLVSQTLRKGLYSLSSGSSGSGTGRAYLQSVYASTNRSQTVSIPSGTGTAQSSDIQLLTTAKGNYDQAISLLTTSRNSYEGARTCYINKLDTGAIAQNQILDVSTRIIPGINTNLFSMIDPLISTLTASSTAIGNRIQMLSGGTTITVGGYNSNSDLTDTLDEVTTDYNNSIDTFTTEAIDANAVLGNSTSALNYVNAQVGTYNSDANRLRSQCDAILSASTENNPDSQIGNNDGSVPF